MPVITGAAVYPENILDKIKAEGVDITAVDTLKLAEEAGNAKASNVVLMGVVSNKMDFEEKLWQDAIEQCVPEKFLELNKKAFELGKNAE
jgi:indolepyruvate ferredoxin oxidoreductase beta subunit